MSEMLAARRALGAALWERGFEPLCQALDEAAADAVAGAVIDAWRREKWTRETLAIAAHNPAHFEKVAHLVDRRRLDPAAQYTDAELEQLARAAAEAPPF